MRKTFALLSLLCAALLSCAPLSRAEERFDPESVRGPVMEKLCMVIIPGADSQVLAAEKGELDIVSDVVRPSDIDRLSADPKLEMSLARGFHAFFLLMNNALEPWNDKRVRQAAALAIDRNGIVRNIFSGYCEPLNSWLPPVSPWALPDASRVVFDRGKAMGLLEEAGYTLDFTRRLVKKGRPLGKIKLLSPLARVAPTTAELAQQIADSLYAVGFDVEVESLDFSAMIARLDRKDYSLAVLAWNMGRNPDSLFSFYHSSGDVEGGYNMTGIHDARLDEALSRLRFAPDKSSAETASRESQLLLADLVPSVPIYSRFSVAAINREWKNVLSTERITADNMWTILRAEHPDPAHVMTMALAEDPRSLNPFTASSAYTWQVLGMIYDGLLGTDPFTLEDIPALAAEWSVAREGEGDGAHTVLRFRLKDGLKWNDGSPMTAADFKATIDFIKSNGMPRYFDSVKDVAEVRADGLELEVIMDGVSYWFLDNISGLPYMPAHVLAGIDDWQSWDPLADGKCALVGAGPFTLDEYRPGEYVMMKRNPHYFRLGNAKDGEDR